MIDIDRTESRAEIVSLPPICWNGTIPNVIPSPPLTTILQRPDLQREDVCGVE
jgi:hypothetical protein